MMRENEIDKCPGRINRMRISEAGMHAWTVTIEDGG